MALKSELFRGDSKLEAAAVSDPHHIGPGAKGDHVEKIQQALNRLDKAALAVDGKYGPATAGAVLAYKRKRQIINKNYQTQADNIVGKRTVIALDEELAALPPPVKTVVTFGSAGHSPVPVSRFKVRAGDSPPGPTDVFKKPAVVRGNVYAPVNAKVDPKYPLPPSLPPRKTYQVDVTIAPPLGKGEFVDIEVINSGGDNGSAKVSPTRLSGSGFVVVSGVQQTAPGKAGQLQLQAKKDGVVLATSEGFSVCAHPSAIRILSSARLVDPEPDPELRFYGITVRIQIESDSGVVADLDKSMMNELVQEPFPRKGNKAFANDGATIGSPKYMDIPANGQGTDSHGYKPFPDTDSLTIEQVHVFKCKRCGAAHVPIAASGFEIVASVSSPDKGKTFGMIVTRSPMATGVNLSPEIGAPVSIYKADPGLGSAKSAVPERVLPRNRRP